MRRMREDEDEEEEDMRGEVVPPHTKRARVVEGEGDEEDEEEEEDEEDEDYVEGEAEEGGEGLGSGPRRRRAMASPPPAPEPLLASVPLVSECLALVLGHACGGDIVELGRLASVCREWARAARQVDAPWMRLYASWYPGTQGDGHVPTRTTTCAKCVPIPAAPEGGVDAKPLPDVEFALRAPSQAWATQEWEDDEDSGRGVARGRWRSVCEFARRTDWAAWAGAREPFPLVSLVDALTPLGQSIYLPFRHRTRGAHPWGPFPPGFVYRPPPAGAPPLPKWAEPGLAQEEDEAVAHEASAAVSGSGACAVECAAVLVSHSLGWGLRLLEDVPRGHLLFEYAGRAGWGEGPPNTPTSVRVEHGPGGAPLARPWHVDAAAEGNLARLLRHAGASQDPKAERGFRRLSPSGGSLLPGSALSIASAKGNVVGRVVALPSSGGDAAGPDTCRVACYARCSIPAGDILSWTHSLAPEDRRLADDAEEEHILRTVFGVFAEEQQAIRQGHDDAAAAASAAAAPKSSSS